MMGHRERMAAKRVRRKDKEQGQGSETAREASEPFGTFVALSSYRHSAVTLMAPPSRVNFWEVAPCQMQSIGQNVATSWRTTVAACRECVVQSKCKSTTEHYNTLADAELLGGLAYEHSLPEDGISPAPSLNVTTRRGDGGWKAVRVRRVLARLA